MAGSEGAAAMDVEGEGEASAEGEGKGKGEAKPKGEAKSSLARLIGANTNAKTTSKPAGIPKKEQLKKRLDAIVANASTLDDEDRGVGYYN